MPKDDLDIPELTREQLGRGVRGKYFQEARDSSNVVILSSENAKAFPTSDAVNEALSKLLIFTTETQRLASGAPSRPKSRAKRAS